jgi:hypothetical protein
MPNIKPKSQLLEKNTHKLQGHEKNASNSNSLLVTYFMNEIFHVNYTKQPMEANNLFDQH